MPDRMWGHVYRVPLLGIHDRGSDGTHVASAAHVKCPSQSLHKRQRVFSIPLGDDKAAVEADAVAGAGAVAIGLSEDESEVDEEDSDDSSSGMYSNASSISGGKQKKTQCKHEHDAKKKMMDEKKSSLRN